MPLSIVVNKKGNIVSVRRNGKKVSKSKTKCEGRMRTAWIKVSWCEKYGKGKDVTDPCCATDDAGNEYCWC